jgi:hypothetical protein
MFNEVRVMRLFMGMAGFFAVLAVLSAASYGAKASPLECKGMTETNCKGEGSCSWVKAHTTKKGAKVSAFCRKKPGRKKAAEAAVPPKS